MEDPEPEKLEPDDHPPWLMLKSKRSRDSTGRWNTQSRVSRPKSEENERCCEEHDPNLAGSAHNKMSESAILISKSVSSNISIV
ncbi:hypothetical protein EON65_18850 [archaeon]|nr:MAG: hypothetical protein EON65_18850 [archaeon]